MIDMNLLILGPSNVGKSTFVNYMTKKSFVSDYIHTFDICETEKTIQRNADTYNIKVLSLFFNVLVY